ncbi:MAG TPA: DUF4386 domain-containing protein [Terracidiphilus sp.]|nr:DUF4386 domain-containing protein [Terracidiphilus sp.]
MNETTQQAHLCSYARATGVVYLSYFATAILGLFLSSRKLPAGVVLNGLASLLYATVTILMYRLFRRAQPLLALAAVLCGLAGCVTDGLNQLHYGPAGVSPLLFFGPFCVLLGVLILRSRFLPRWLGWPLTVAGLGWLAYLNPQVAQHAQIVIFPVGFLAEFALMLWLLLRGVDEARWRETESSA